MSGRGSSEVVPSTSGGASAESGCPESTGVSGLIGLRVPGIVTYRHVAIGVVGMACRIAGAAALGRPTELEAAEDDFEAQVISGFGEAFNNVVLHAYRDLTPGPVSIELGWDDERFVITMTDSGHRFDPADAFARTPSRLPGVGVVGGDLEQVPETGMGLLILHACMDEVSYEPGPPNVLRLVKWHAGGRGGARPKGGDDDHEVPADRRR